MVGYKIMKNFDNYRYTYTETVAICLSFERAIQYLIEECGLDENYIYTDFYGKTTLKEEFGENWISELINKKITYFSFEDCDYEIEECNILE